MKNSQQKEGFLEVTYSNIVYTSRIRFCSKEIFFNYKVLVPV